MDSQDSFGTGLAAGSVPQGDVAREAVASLRGYAYQVVATALAWLDIAENGRIFLEVAEDYATLAGQALNAVQIKDTEKSQSVTLNSPSVRCAIAAFVDLIQRNPGVQVDLRFFTTSKIGTEKTLADRPAGRAGLEYWKEAATGADVGPIRLILESDKFREGVRKFSQERDDDALRHELIKRVQWDCGKPDFSTLRQEVEERLVVVGRDQFHLPATDARRLVDLLIFHVLKKSILEDPKERVLTRAELYSVIDLSTQVSVRRADVSALVGLSAMVPAVLRARTDETRLISTDETRWLIDGATLPHTHGMIARPHIESKVSDALENFGVTILSGSGGLGKSVVARSVAHQRGIPFFMVHFRNAQTEEVRAQLDMIFSRIGGMPSSILILEDLNQMENPDVIWSLARVIEAVRHRYRSIIVTCHLQPSLNVLTSTDLQQSCVVDIPYFSEEEVCTLVDAHEGNPESWGRLAYLSGGFGHPQLTHAFVKGLSGRGWPLEEMGVVIEKGLSSLDIDAARETTRRNLVSALAENARTLLYRLSFTVGSFDRVLALALGEISPSIAQPGEALDQLVGPWVEAIGEDLFHVSPLVKNSGTKILSPSEQAHIHNRIAVQMLAKGSINASDIDKILMHAIIGRSVLALTTIAHSVLSADSDSLDNLAEHIMLFRFIRNDVPIFSEVPIVSRVLRVAQLRLATADLENSNISEIVTAVIGDIDTMSEGEEKQAFECAVLLTVLATKGIANYLDDWLALLLRLETISRTNRFIRSIVGEVTETDVEPRPVFFGGLFSVGSAYLSDVHRLEKIINQLDEVDANRRAILLTPMDDSLSDYFSLINGPWAEHERDHNFDAIEAGKAYRRMVEKTINWGIRPLSIQCVVAQAILLDEYQNDREGAQAVLHGAVATMGEDPILHRALAKIHFRHNEYESALTLFRNIVSHASSDNPAQSAFTLREAAISAANCGEWSQAEKWFLLAQDAAGAVGSSDMDVMAVGLGADAAVASLKKGDIGKALAGLAKALEALRAINPESTLRAAHCHRLIRHTVLWAQSRIEGLDLRIGGKPTLVTAGSCSNPDPVSAIRERPLPHIDFAWYMLAEAETTATPDRRISSTLHKRLESGPIPSSELSLRIKAIEKNCGNFDAVGFSNCFTPYIEVASFMLKEGKNLRETFDPSAPDRRDIPELESVAPFKFEVERVAIDAILAYCMNSIFTNRPQEIANLELNLINTFPDAFPGQTIFEQLTGKAGIKNELDKIVAHIIRTLSSDNHPLPSFFWFSGLRFFEWINQTSLNSFLLPRLCIWQRSGWLRIISKERFRLSTPLQTVPTIQEALTIPENNRSFAANLLVTSSHAVGSSLESGYLASLKAMVTEEGAPSMGKST